MSTPALNDGVPSVAVPAGDTTARWRRPALIAAACGLVLGFIGGLLVHRITASSPGHDVTVIRGTAVAGSREIALNATEWKRVSGRPLSAFYGSLGWDVTSVTWIDANGGLNVGGTPACVRVGEHPDVEAGVLEAKQSGSHPGGVVLVWLRCLSS